MMRTGNSPPTDLPPPRRGGAAAAARQAGFTLIELLVVLVILGLLAGLVAPRVLNYVGGSRNDAAKLQMENFASALDLYKLDVGAYPTTEQGLGALVQAPPGVSRWRGPYLGKQAVPADPWGHAYGYRAPGERGPYDLFSPGPDGGDGAIWH